LHCSQRRGHGQYLVDTHEAFASLDQAGDCQRKGRKQGGTQNDENGDAGDVRGREIQMDTKHESQAVDDDALGQPSDACRKSFA